MRYKNLVLQLLGPEEKGHGFEKKNQGDTVKYLHETCDSMMKQ